MNFSELNRLNFNLQHIIAQHLLELNRLNINLQHITSINLLELINLNFNTELFLANLYDRLWYYSAVFKNVLSQNSFILQEIGKLIKLKKYFLPIEWCFS